MADSQKKKTEADRGEKKEPNGPPVVALGEMVLSHWGPGGDFVDNGIPIEAQRTDRELTAEIAARLSVVKS